MNNDNRSELDKLIDFVQLSLSFQSVKRKVRANGQMRWETNGEHASQLLLVSTYIYHRFKLNFNLGKIAMLVLAHDLHESKCEDLCIFLQRELDDVNFMLLKKNVEKEAQKAIKAEFPDFYALHEAIDEYEACETPEARFVCALDKLLPAYNILLDNGATWKQFRMTLGDWTRAKEEKIRNCPIGTQLLDELLVKLRNQQGTLFHPSSVPLLERDLLPLPGHTDRFR
jgi:putative hydrolases of HD superfamily